MTSRIYTIRILLLGILCSIPTEAQFDWGDFDFELDPNLLAELSKSVEGFMSSNPLFAPAPTTATAPHLTQQQQQQQQGPTAFFQQLSQAAQPFLEDIQRLGGGFIGPFFSGNNPKPTQQQQPATAAVKPASTPTAKPTSLFPTFEFDGDSIVKLFTSGGAPSSTNGITNNALGSWNPFGGVPGWGLFGGGSPTTSTGSSSPTSKAGDLSRFMAIPSMLSPQAKMLMQALQTYTDMAIVQDQADKSLFEELKETLQGIDSSLNMTAVKTSLQRSGSLDLLELFALEDSTLAELASASQDLEAKLCTRDQATLSVKQPLTCVGPNITLSVQTGHCSLREDKKVVCKPPRVMLIKTPGECWIPHLKPTTIETKVCKWKKEIGRSKEGIIFGNKTIVMDISRENFGARISSQSLAKDSLSTAKISSRAANSSAVLDRIEAALKKLKARLPQ